MRQVFKRRALGPQLMRWPTVAIDEDAYAITVAGTDRTLLIDRHSIDVVDDVYEQPNKMSFECFGFTPAVGEAVVFTVGLQKEFAGKVTRVKESHYRPSEGRVSRRVECIDHTYDLASVLVTASYGSQSASTTAAAILALAPVGFTTSITGGLPTVAAIQFKETPIPDALSQLCEAFGGAWFPDEDKVVFVFETEATFTPETLSTSSTKWRKFSRDQSSESIVNRIFVEGLGAAALVERAVGDTTLPIDDASWAAAGGGSVFAGNQILTYTGRELGGAGAIVTGDVAGPTSAPTVAVPSGEVGNVVGGVGYVVAFSNALGETGRSTAVNIDAGVAFAAPSSAPSPALASGAGEVLGAVRYKVAFGTAMGETEPCASPSSTVTGVVFPVPTSTGAVDINSGGQAMAGPLEGTYSYKATNITALGETTGGSASSNASPALLSNPLSVSQSGSATGGLLVAGTNYKYKVTAVNAYGGETLASSASSNCTPSGGNTAITVAISGTVPATATHWRLYRTIGGPGGAYRYVAQIAIGTTSYTDTLGDSELGQAEPLVNSYAGAITLSSIPAGPTGTLGRAIYRTKAGGSLYYLVIVLQDNSTSSFTDRIPDEALTLGIPLANTAGGSKVSLTSIPTGPAGCTSRLLYRELNSGSNYYYIGTINDNSTTTFTDNVPDYALGRLARVTSTAGAAQVNLTNIPLGGTGVTQRVLYRTKSGGSYYLYLATIENNTATTYTDNIPDSALGRIALETSAIGVAAASTSVRLSTVTGFPSSGWLKADSQFIRYTGISSLTLTGIPASGVGSIVGALKGGLTVVALPFLSGIPSSSTGSILYVIGAGDEINLLVQRDDATSQSTYGIRQKYVQDRRLSIAGANARGDAELAVNKDPRISGTYTTIDQKVRSGRAVTVSMSSEWGISATYKIVKVRKYFEPARTQLQREVSFSNVSGERDLYRILRALQRDIKAAA